MMEVDESPQSGYLTEVISWWGFGWAVIIGSATGLNEMEAIVVTSALYLEGHSSSSIRLEAVNHAFFARLSVASRFRTN